MRGIAVEVIAIGGDEADASGQLKHPPIPLGTLKRWAASGYESPDKKSWYEQRAAIEMDRANISSRMHHLAGKAIEDAVKSGEAKDIFAAVAAAKALQGEGDAELRRVKLDLAKAELALKTAHKEGAAEVGADVIYSAMQDVPELAKVLKNQRVREALKRAIEKKLAESGAADAA